MPRRWSSTTSTGTRGGTAAASTSGKAINLIGQNGGTGGALGGAINLPGVDGHKVEIKIPAGIQSGEQLRQRGSGMSVLNGRGRGDLVARVLVETPTRLNSKQKKILEEFRETETGDECPASKSFFSRIRDTLGG